MSDRKAVVSFADGAGYYAKAMMRLEQSLRSVKFDGDFIGINDYGHISSPHHKGTNSVPYAFKANSIRKVMTLNHDLLLWCDSVVYATKDITPIFDHIKREGYLLFDNIGYSIGDYTSDACLAQFGMTREEAFNSKMVMACVMGFDLRNSTSKELLQNYISAASDGVSYQGDWVNNDMQVSNDMRVCGHRHDQSVISVLAKKMGLTLTNAQSTYFAYSDHKGKVNISDSVSMWSQGI